MKNLIFVLVLFGGAAETARGEPIVYNPDDEALNADNGDATPDDGTLEGLRDQNRLLRRQIRELQQKLERLEQLQDQAQRNRQYSPQVQIVIPGSYAYPDQSSGSFGWGTTGGIFIGSPSREDDPHKDGHHKDNFRRESDWRDRHGRR